MIMTDDRGEHDRPQYNPTARLEGTGWPRPSHDSLSLTRRIQAAREYAAADQASQADEAAGEHAAAHTDIDPRAANSPPSYSPRRSAGDAKPRPSWDTPMMTATPRGPTRQDACGTVRTCPRYRG